MENKVSIVVPVYNSASTLPELATRVFKVMDTLPHEWELLLIDDGSTDSSWETIKTLKAQYGERLKGIRLSKNFGQHNALCCGFFHSTGAVVVTMDDDLQHPPEEIPRLLEHFRTTRADVVYGIPQSTSKSTLRKMGSHYVKRTSAYYKQGGKGGSAFRAVGRNIIDPIMANHTHNFVYIDAIFNWYTDNIEHVKVNYEPSAAGKSRYSLLKLLGIYVNLMINYSATPLKWITWLGFIIGAISFWVGVYFIYRKLMHNVPLGYTSIIVSISYGTGAIMCSLGILGQYIYKIYQLQYQRPVFNVQSVI